MKSNALKDTRSAVQGIGYSSTRQRWRTKDELRTAIFHFIEIYYNRQRPHSSLGYLTPEAYGRRYAHQQAIDS